MQVCKIFYSDNKSVIKMSQFIITTLLDICLE